MSQVDESPDIHSHREWLLSLAPIPPAGTLVDLGCGRGDDILLAAAQEPSNDLRLVGIDADPESIATAREGAGDDSRIEFRQEKLDRALPFDSGSLDVIYSNNLIECFPDPSGFAEEVARVLKPGGWTVMAHWDWDSQVFDSSDKDLVRSLVAAFADWEQAWMDHSDGWMGRRLWGTFNAPGLLEGRVEARTMVNTIYSPPWFGYGRVQDMAALVKRDLVSEGEYWRFVSEQEALGADGEYFYSITGFAYVGRKRPS